MSPHFSLPHKNKGHGINYLVALLGKLMDLASQVPSTAIIITIIIKVVSGKREGLSTVQVHSSS